ncbi:MAG: DUF1456 family protein [Thermodesulfovibrionales bacterium]|nr:DUF1456 family protein [Thermodesulfovibrionales bacterium]
MNKNDVLRKLRYALNLNDSAMLELFRLTDHEIEQSKLTGLLKKEDDEGFVACRDDVLGYFLDGLILQRRGRKEAKPCETRKPDPRLTNNAVLKKLRIALELKEEDMRAILKLADVDLSKSELTALFRKEGHKNYKECGDQFLRKFLQGLSIRYRT